VNPGDVIVYTFTVENTGNVTLSGPVLTELTFGDLDVTCPWDGNPAYELLPGFVNRVNCTADYSVTQADIDAGEVLNCALIEATTASEQTVEAEACTTVDEPPEPDIDIVKEVMTPEVSEGDTVEFKITVTNTGNVTLSEVVVTDVLSPDCDRTFGGILIPGESVSYECSVDSILVAFTNVAVVTATPPVPPGATSRSISAEDDAPVVIVLLGEIGDLVWNDDNSNGVQDAGEKGISGALVKLTLPDSTTMNTTTGTDGSYLFEELPAGTYKVELVMSSIPAPSEGELKLTTAGSYTIDLTADEIYLAADFGVVAVLPVTGIDTTTIALIALALLLAGGAAVFITTRKRKEEGDIAA